MSKVTDLNLEEILDRVENGESFMEIAESLGVARATIRKALEVNEEISANSARARQESAESWLDRGMSYLKTARSDPNEIARARALAQECARRAAIRNPKYSDKQRVEHEGSVRMNVTISAEDSGVL